jgi:hypothetical protein
MAYFLRAHSLVGEHLDRELIKRGAHTSGSTARKQQRLQRFMEIETNLDWVIRNEQAKVAERGTQRAAELVWEGVRQVVREKGAEEARPEIAEMLRRCPPAVIDHIREHVYGRTHGYNLRSRS